MKKGTLFTLGYEGLTSEAFCKLVSKQGVDLVADVRKNAISRKKGFSKNKLREALEPYGVEYVHLPSLGIPSETRKKAKTERDWQKMLHNYEAHLTPDDWEMIVRFLHEGKNVALLCFEKEPEECHRTRLLHRITQQNPKLKVEEIVPGAAPASL